MIHADIRYDPEDLDHIVAFAKARLPQAAALQAVRGVTASFEADVDSPVGELTASVTLKPNASG